MFHIYRPFVSMNQCAGIINTEIACHLRQLNIGTSILEL